jgi:hypothetical protein
MSRKNYIAAMLLTATFCAQQGHAANSPEFQWGAVLRSNDTATASGLSGPNVIKVNASGELFTLGTFSSHTTNAYKYASYKHYDAAGTLTVKATPEGAPKETTGANANLFLYKQDAQGQILWQVTSCWGNVAGAYSQVTPTSDGGALLAAKVQFTVSSAFAADTLLQLIDNSGAKHAVLWTESTQNAYQIVAAKLSSSGQVQWVKHLVRVNDANGTDAIRATGLEVGADGSYYLGGRYNDTITFDKAGGGTQQLTPRNAGGDFLLAKLDPDGSYLWSVEATGAIASQGINSMTLHRNALYLYGNVQGDGATSSTLLGHAIVPSSLTDNAYSARIDVGGATPTARWVRLFNARAQTNTKGGRIKVTNINYDGGSVFLSGSFTGFIDKADGTAILANDLTSGTSAAQLTAFIIRQDPYTGEVLGQVRDDSTGISEAYAVALRGSKVHSYGYTSSGAAWYRAYNADFTGEAHYPLIAGGTAFGGLFLDSALVALSRGRNATVIPGVTDGIANEAPPAFSAYFLSFGIDSLWQKNLFEQLENAIDSAKALNPLSYTPSTWTALQDAVDAAEALLAGVPSEQEAGEALADIRTAKAGVAAYSPEFQWGGVVRSTAGGNATPTTVTQTISVSADGGSLFTFGNFTTEKTGASRKAIYKGYDAADTVTVEKTTPDGSIQSAGNNSKTNLLIHKFDRQGDLKWQLTSDRGLVDVAYSQVAPTADSGLLLALKVGFSGTTGGDDGDSILLRLVEDDGVTTHTLKWGNPQTNARQVALAKVDANGHVLWLKHGIKVSDIPISGTTTGQATDAIYINGLEEDRDGNFYIAGRYVKNITFSTPGGDTTITPANTAGWNGDSQTSRGDALLAKLDPNGNLLWHLEKAGTLFYQSVGAMALNNGKLFIAGNAQATAGQAGVDYFAVQGDTIFPSEKNGAYVARFDVSSGTPTLQWLTALKARVQTNTKGGSVWVHNLDYDGGELFLTGRFTGFIDKADGTNIVANDVTSGTSTASQDGYIIRLNATTGDVSAAARRGYGISGYYRAALRENRVYVFGYHMGQTFYQVHDPNFTTRTETTLFSGGMATAWDAAFFDDQLIAIHRTRQTAPYIYGIEDGQGLRTENAFAFSAYYTSHSFAGLQRPAVTYRDALEDSISAVRVAYTDSTPYSAASWGTLQQALAAGDALLAGQAPIDEQNANAAITAVRNAVSGLVTKDIGALIAQLQDAIDTAKVRYPQEEAYTPQTWDTLQAAITGGEILLAVPAEATEEELIAAINALSDAVGKLMPRVLNDARNALIALIDSAAGYEAAPYTAATYAALQVATAAAQAGVDAGNAATVASLQALVEDLGTAIDGLVTKVSAARDALQDTIIATRAAYADTATYTAATYAALQDTLAAAQALVDDDGEHTVAEYEAATAGIGSAIGGLVTKISAARVALQDSIESVRSTYAQASYTAASWAVLQATLATAEAALDDPNASLDYLEGEMSALREAVAGLVPVSTGVYRVANGSNVIVTTRRGAIVVRGAQAGATITVVSAAGSVIHRRTATGDAQEFPVSVGLYIVVAGQETAKVAVTF